MAQPVEVAVVAGTPPQAFAPEAPHSSPLHLLAGPAPWEERFRWLPTRAEVEVAQVAQALLRPDPAAAIKAAQVARASPDPSPAPHSSTPAVAAVARRWLSPPAAAGWAAMAGFTPQAVLLPRVPRIPVRVAVEVAATAPRAVPV